VFNLTLSQVADTEQLCMDIEQIAANPAFKRSPSLKRAEGWRDRLREAFEKSGMSPRALEAKIFEQTGHTLSYNTIASVIRRRGGVQLSSLTLICDGLGVDLFYILGAGNQRTVSSRAVIPHEKSIVGIAVVPLAFANEYDDIVETNKELDFFFTDEHDPKTKAVRVQDDSMADELIDGDLVLFDAKAKPKKGDNVIVQLGGKGDCIIRKWGGESAGGKVTLTAVNPDYGKNTVSAKVLNVIGVQIGYLRTN
jgi:SOS-response transcriptional repressor LexA